MLSNGVNETKDLIKSVNGIGRALWIRHIIEQTLRLGFYGAMVSMLLILLVKFSALFNWMPVSYCLGPVVLGVGLGFLLGLIRKPHHKETALFLDSSLSLQNRLATLLEHIKLSPSRPLVKALLSDTIRYQPQFSPAVVYKHFNTNYLFRYLLAGLGIIIFLLVPGYLPPALAGFSDITREQSERIKTTAQDIAQFSQLDETTQRLINDMERMSQVIEAGEISPEDIIKQLEALSEKVRQQVQHHETGQELISYISLVTGETPTPDTAKLDPDYVRQALKRLEEQIRQGRVAIDFLESLRQALVKAQGTVKDDPLLGQALEEGIKALKTPDIHLVPALQKFFEVLGRKNRALLERIQARLDIARKEIAQAAKLTDSRTVKGSDAHFSHGTDSSEKPDPFEIPLTPTMNSEKMSLIKQVLKYREAAFDKPYWPAEYNEIIRQYFK